METGKIKKRRRCRERDGEKLRKAIRSETGNDWEKKKFWEDRQRRVEEKRYWTLSEERLENICNESKVRKRKMRRSSKKRDRKRYFT
jgi:hypothetical protein